MTDDMTDRAEAPERIWAWNTANCDGDWTIAGGLGVEYVRADVALAITTAALRELVLPDHIAIHRIIERSGAIADALSQPPFGKHLSADALAALEAVKERRMTESIEIFDDDGYPTNDFLGHIASWDYRKGFDSLLQEAMEGHIYPNCRERTVEDGKAVWRISTGGWSGNESILAALQENYMFWLMCWQQSRRGGHYIFHCPLALEDTPND